MPYLLDSDVLRYYLDDVPTVVDLMAELVPHGVAISIISYLELYQGTLQTPDPEESQERLETLLTSLPVLPLSLSVARRCAHLREQLKHDGKRVRQRAFDLVIAATALHHGLTLVTNNRQDFEDIPGVDKRFFQPAP